MTTRTHPLTAMFPAGPRFAWARLAFTFALTLSAILVFGATFAIGYARMNDGRVLPGVDVGGIDVAGLSRGSAEARLRAELPSLNAGNLTVRIANVERNIPYADFGREYNFDYMLNRAFELGRASSFAEQLREQIAILVNGLSVPPVVTWNSEQLAMRVASLAAAVQVAPIDAAITRQDGHYVVTPSSSGTAVNVNDAVEMAMAAVNNLSPAGTAIAIPGTTISAAVSTELAQAAADQAERVAAADLTVSATDLSTTIDADVLRGWIHLDAVALGQLLPGERRKEQDRYDAFESWVTRTVRDVPGSVIHQDTFYSNYRKLDAITLVGRYSDDPPAGTRIPPDAYPHAAPGT